MFILEMNEHLYLDPIMFDGWIMTKNREHACSYCEQQLIIDIVSIFGTFEVFYDTIDTQLVTV